MNPTQLKVEEAISKLDEQDAKQGEEVKDDVKASEDTKSADKSAGGDDTAGQDTKRDDKSDEGDNKEPEEEFTADDAEEVDEPAVEEAAPTTDASGVQLSNAEQKYIVDNIGEPLTIRGFRGEGDERKEVELKVFSPDQLPADFQFANQASLLQAQNAFVRMEQKAEQLLGSYRNQQSQTQAADFERRENEGIQLDVAELQKAGEFPKFKIRPGMNGFDSDPAAIQMTEVLQVMTERNDQYLKEYQQGRPYRHIGFREAFEIYERKQGSKKTDDAQKQEDTERKEVADKVGTNRGLSTSKLQKAAVPRGMSIEDIINRHELADWNS